MARADGMRVLIVGSGGREHAMARAMLGSGVSGVFCAPGNAGIEISRHARCNPKVSATDIAGLVAYAKELRVDLTVIGPEQPLVNGVAEAFAEAGLLLLGPSAKAARLEGSKICANQFMRYYNIPHPESEEFGAVGGIDAVLAYVAERGAENIVIKADGLAAGKGVVLPNTLPEAEAALNAMMIDGVFGEAGRRVVIQKRLRGFECSFFVLSDGTDYVVFPSACDYKRLEDDDYGPNTGGMGAHSPSLSIVSRSRLLRNEVIKQIVEPTLLGMARNNNPYKGFLYFGLMVTKDGPVVLEFNCRLGDPETQVILPRLQPGDFFTYCLAAAQGELGKLPSLTISQETAVCVVAASKGYPGKAQTGDVISGLNELEERSSAQLYYAGVAESSDASVVTAGGRVLGVTGLGFTYEDARREAYHGLGFIDFSGMQYRTDIATQPLR